MDEFQHVDLQEARKRHLQLNSLVKKSARQCLAQADELKLSSAETSILMLLISHQHPRRQLFWAFQTRERFPGLEKFFEDNIEWMLGVTSTGAIVRRP